MKISTNNSKRTFTIRKQGLKFRTNKMNRVDFQSSLNSTARDWQDYLDYSNDYYLVK